MAGTINHLYDPNQVVYVIHGCDKAPKIYVTSGTVIRIRAEVLLNETKLYYDVRLAGAAGTDEFLEADVFADKSSAISEYDARVD